MDRVFSVDEMADPFWLSHPPIRLGDGEEQEAEPPSSSSASTIAKSKMTMGMNRSSSEWAFQRFLQEAAAPDRNPTTVQPSSSSTNPPQNDDVVEIKGNHRYSGVAVNGNQPQQSKMAAAASASASGVPPSNISVDSDEYQAYLKSQLELACAAVALTRVILQIGE